MEFKIYSLPNCSSCAHLKELINRVKEKTIAETVVGVDMTVEDFKKEYPNIERLPHVFIDGVEVGGLVEVATKLLKEGLVTPPQK